MAIDLSKSYEYFQPEKVDCRIHIVGCGSVGATVAELLVRLGLTNIALWDKLELDGLDYKERAKVATQLAKCRQARRECKDTVEILEPLVQFLESDKGKNLLNLVREALGKTRKVEERMETRTYIPRVLEQEATT